MSTPAEAFAAAYAVCGDDIAPKVDYSDGTHFNDHLDGSVGENVGTNGGDPDYFKRLAIQAGVVHLLLWLNTSGNSQFGVHVHRDGTCISGHSLYELHEPTPEGLFVALCNLAARVKSLTLASQESGT